MYEHFKGDEQFVRQILDYQEQALYKQKIVLTKFLDPHKLDLIKTVIGKNDELQIINYGGFNECENSRVIIAPSFYEINEEDFKIEVVKINYASRFEKLEHRDILGALMALGIKRELFGDIVKYQDEYYLAVDKTILEYLKDNLKQVKRSKVKLTLSNEKITVKKEYRIKSFIISSFRLDKVVSSLFNIPRNQASEFIRMGLVKVNHKIVVEINYLCNNKDIISLRKHGRVMLVDLKRKTRNDNYVVEGYYDK